MLKTYLYVPEELNREIQKVADTQNLSKAAVIRAALKEGLGIVKKQKSGGAEALLKIAEIGKKINAKGPTDLSLKMDKYLWDAYEQ